jgi:hypothetical protein
MSSDTNNGALHGTLFSIFRPAVHVADLRPLGTYLVEAIEAELRAEKVFPPTRSPSFSPTAFGSRRPPAAARSAS